MKESKEINENKRFAADLEPGEELKDCIFGIENIELKKTRNDSPYLDLVLFDKTGSVRAKFWDRADISMPDVYRTLQQANLVSINGNTQIFNENIQIDIINCRPVKREQDDPVFRDIIRSTSYDIDYLWEGIQQAIDNVGNPQIKTLLEKIFSDKKIAESLRVKPAAAKVHHAYRGGLLEHVYNLLNIIKAIRNGNVYSSMNWDLVIAGALLHDIGKIVEINGDQISQGYHYSRHGMLFGHIFIGASLINRFINEIEGFDENIKLELIHIVLSHHGKLEWGSPVEMRTPEAILLHSVDHMDAQVSHCMEALSRSSEKESEFTNKYLSSLYKQFYKSRL